MTEKAFGSSTLKIEFAFKGIETAKPSVVGPEGEGKQFKVTPAYEEIGSALDFGDNNSIVKSAKGIEINYDQIGMMHTTLFFYAAHGYKTGYVRTSGENAEKVYSAIACSIK